MNCRLPIADCRTIEDAGPRPANGTVKGGGSVRPVSSFVIRHSNLIRHSSFEFRHSPGFTLVEVLVSIAIALLLIVGIGQVFSLAQRTSGAGTTLVKLNGIQRSIQVVLDQDFHGIVTDPSDSPGMVIASYSVPAFRNAQDQQASPNSLQPEILNPPAGFLQQAFNISDRYHRVDRMCFFARGQYRRQTADSPNLTSPTASTEAFIWLGHLALPNNAAIAQWNPNNPSFGITPGSGSEWFNPGAQTDGPATNDNNAFASSWILGRQVILLAATGNENGFIAPGAATAPPYASPISPTPNAANATIPPLSMLVPQAHDTSVGLGNPIFLSRYDLSYTTMDYCRRQIQAAETNNRIPWWQNLSGLDLGATNLVRLPNAPFQRDVRYVANPYPTKPGQSSPTYKNYTNNPALWLSAWAAQTAPIFVRGCTQFIVEFAGDYVAQDPAGPVPGRVISSYPDTDGQIDYIVDSTTGQRRIRWYGFPRDTADGDATGANRLTNTGAPFPDGCIDSFDVIPVSWYITNAGQTVPGKGWFERDVPDPSALSSNLMSFIQTAATNNSPKMVTPPYVCAWGPNTPAALRPKMIRITIGIDEPNGRLGTQQIYEFIYTLP